MDAAVNRRRFLQVGLMAAASYWGANRGLGKPVQAATLPPPDLLSNPDAALQELMAGNQRFAQHHPTYPHQNQARVKSVSQAQHPFATVLSCADSRVPVEILFDQGVGDIFDVRVAGNIVTPEVMGSLEYGIALLETPVLMVLGHERCGAVTAAVKQDPLPGDISTFVEAILPAVQQVQHQNGDAVENAVAQNIKYQLGLVQASTLVADRLRAGTLKLVGARYDLDTGTVQLIA
ncbi:carbonic anhydrase [Lyngbya confervoides]|uniref:Carbonic anhydrase n=1 Tax=Lyngbya confervoides BDU141951 TaxID=1574623 RepID=A0ABD4SZE8_9CYAN|nr:carbonic anhydrase [Lyngbya confervoides]MCM1981659.1 carbonic anhydrase [Lyngbya confervoides BDU141951]